MTLARSDTDTPISPSQRSFPWLPLSLSLLALAVRLTNLTYHSIWFDEAMSVHWARSSISRIWQVSMNLVEDRLPPLYYLLLHGWRLLFGDGEIAMRLPSVILGVLLVPVIYQLARDLFDHRTATLAALLVALNPFLVWYSQEARMYALAALLGALGTWCFVRALSRPWASGWAWWVGYSLCAAAGFYTHLYTAFLLPAHALYLLLTWRRSRRVWIPYVLTMIVTAALSAPLTLAILRVSVEAGPGNPWQGLAARLWDLHKSLTLWQAPLSPTLTYALPAGMLLLAAVGLLLKGEQSQGKLPHPRLFVALLWLLPLAVATLLMTRNKLAFFGARYFIVVLPWLLLAVALGARTLSRRLAAVRWPARALAPLCLLLPVVLTLIPLPGQWSPPARKEAWRETVAFLANFAQPDDAILIHPDWTRYPLQYYFRGPGQTYAVFSSVDANTQLDPPLEVISSQHPVVWLVESHTELADPEHRVNAWLAARYPLVTELYPAGLAGVHAYAPGYISADLPPYATSADVPFANGLRLKGAWLPTTTTRATDDLFHPPSAWLHVALFWQIDSPLTAEAVPFVRLVDDAGQVWGASLDRSNDAFDFYPPARWQPDQIVRADFDVNLNPLTPPGAYTLVLGLRDPSGSQIPLTDDIPQAVLSPITITR
jgi:mannosyltransferase